MKTKDIEERQIDNSQNLVEKFTDKFRTRMAINDSHRYNNYESLLIGKIFFLWL